MSWLFTQVWLWSLAAFALGSLLTWWLFARPLRRELRELAPVEEPEEAWDAAPEEAPLDLLRAPEESVRTDDELERVRGSGEPAFGDWDRPARWGPYGRRGAEDGALRPDEEREPAAPGRGEEPLVERSVPTEQPEVDPVDGGGRNAWFRNDDLGEPHQAYASQQPHEWSGTLDAPAGDDGSRGIEHDRTTSGADAPEDEVSSDTRRIPGTRASSDSDAARAERGGSSGEPADSEVSPDSDGRDEDKSARLRSLFEPAVLPQDQNSSARNPGDQNPGAEEPGDQHRDSALPEEATQHIPRVDDQPRTEDEARTADEQGASPPSSGSAEPSSEVRNVDGSLRAAASAADFGGGAGALIKAHFASQQYHTPESPQYDRIAAEAWFRTASDAEQAGFEPWDGHPRAVQN